MKFNLIDFRVLFALFVCLCLFVSISSISAAEVNDGIEVDEFDANEVEESFAEDVSCEIAIISSESTDSDTLVPDKQTDSNKWDNESFVNATSTKIYKYLIKKPYSHRFSKDSTFAATMHRYYIEKYPSSYQSSIDMKTMEYLLDYLEKNNILIPN